jgi:predicted dehydrogenase
LVAVGSRNQARAEAFADKHGAQVAYISLDAFVADARVDVVFIASPNFLQAPYTTIAAQAGKHVLVEKPMAVRVDEAVEMVQTCREHGVKLGAGIRGRTEIPFEVFREARSGNRSA